MSRDIEERLRLFMHEEGEVLEFKRIGLTMNQVREYNPPENPAKATDARFAQYVRDYGESCWELDALEPTVISELIAEHVLDLRNHDLHQKMERKQATQREHIKDVGKHWDKALEAATKEEVKPAKKKRFKW